jgi:hypothetical protein
VQLSVGSQIDATMIVATTENVLLCERDEKLTAFWELESKIRAVTL